MPRASSMNHIFRSVWNASLGAMVAVAEVSTAGGGGGTVKVRAKGKKGLKSLPILSSLLSISKLSLSIAGAFTTGVVLAQTNTASLPTGATAIHGTATLTTPQANKLVVTTTNGAGTSHSAVNWQSFSIGAGNTVQITQPSAASTSINRVVTNTPSALFGNLNSNGRVVLVNQAGITIGAGAYVDTAGFTASVVGMSEANAKAGRLKFDSNVLNNGGDLGPIGSLIVQGNIIARGGDVVLIAPSMELAKTAVVEAQGGAVMLAAGQSVEITGRGLEGITMQVQAPSDSAINLGTLKGDAVGIFAGTLKHSGLIQANLITGEGGKVLLKASGDAYVEGDGKIIATGSTGKGGSVDVLGQRVAVIDNALIDVSGQTGGGGIRIGGDYQGKNASVQNADYSYLGPNAVLKADALQNGDGGRVIVWSDDTTRAHGSISVRGGEQGGDGGFVETSGHHSLVATRAPDLAAPHGKGGTWLLDPSDISISHATGPADVQITPGSPFTPTQSDSSSSGLTDFTISAALTSGDVVITTASSGTGSGQIIFNGILGTVLIQSPASAARNLTLNATTSVVFVQGNTTFAAGSSGSLNVNVGATSDTFIAASGSVTLDGTSGNVTASVSSNRTWYNDGLLQMNGNAQVNLGSLNTVNGLSYYNGTTGTTNVNSTNGFAFYGAAAQLATISNNGIFNVSGNTAIAVAFGQSASGTLNLKNVSVNLQNANDIRGTVDLFPAGATVSSTLYVNEFHGTKATFVGTNFPSVGTLAVGGSSGGPSQASFSGVTAPLTNLAVGSIWGNGVIDFLTGNTVFSSLTVGGSSSVASMTNANLGIKGSNLTIPNITTYSGSNGFYATGNITLSTAAINSGGVNMTLMASWDGVSAMSPTATRTGSSSIALGNNIIASGNLNLISGGDITQSGGGVTADTLTVVSGGGVSLAGSSNDVNTFAASKTGGNTNQISYWDLSTLSLGAITNLGGDVEIKSDGNLNQVASTAITVSGLAVDATAGDITLANSGNTFAGGTVSLSGGAVNVKSAGAMSVGSLSVASNSSNFLEAAGTLSLPASSLNAGPLGSFSFISGGALSTAGALFAGSISLQGTSVALNHNVNADFGTGLLRVIATSGAITNGGGGSLTASGNLQVSSLSALTTSVLNWTLGSGKNLSVTSGGNLTISTPIVDRFLVNLTSTGGSLNLTGDASASGFVVFSAANGSVTLQNVATNGGALSVNAQSISAGNLSTMAASAGGAGGNMTLTATAGGITTGGLETRAVLGSGGTLGGSSGNLGVNATGAITIGGIRTDGFDLFSATFASAKAGDITLESFGGLIDLGYAFARGNPIGGGDRTGGTVNMKASGSISVGSVGTQGATGGSVTLDSGGLLTVSGGGVVTDQSSSTTGGAITIKAADVTLTSALYAGDGNVTISAAGSSSIGLGAASTGMTISGAELQNITAANLFLNTGTAFAAGSSGVREIVVDGISAANSANIGKVTLTSSGTGTNRQITFSGAASTFGALDVRANDGVFIRADITTTTGGMSFASNINNSGGYWDEIVTDGNRTLSSAGAINFVNNFFIGSDYPTGSVAGNVTITGQGISFGGGLYIQNDTGKIGTVNAMGGTLLLAGTVTTGINDLTLAGANIALNGNINATGRTVSLQANTPAGVVTQGAGTFILASGLELKGSGSFLLNNAGNNVSTLAAASGGGSDGAIEYTDADGFNVGTVNTVGITRNGNVSLKSLAGSIGQTDRLITTGLLYTQSAMGTVLNRSDNQVAAFKAESTATGNIELTSVGAIDVQGIRAADGNIVINNTGGISTSGAVLAPKGSVKMKANSPLTIGLDGITSSGNIDLVATNQTSPGNMIINGNLTSTSGAITLDAAGNLLQNSVLNGALGVNATAGGSMVFGLLASAVGNPISYRANGATVSPPGTSTISPVNFLDVFLDKFEDALAAQNEDNTDPLNKKKNKDKDALVVEGETCKP